jgi:hypothetical protein
MFFLYIFSLAFAVFAAWAYGRSTDRVIAETNLETERLKKENLTLRTDLDSEAGKVAGLQKAASDALAEQQRVQRQLSEQQGRTAVLEKTASDAQNALVEQKGKTAQLEKAAANAKATQQRVETDLAKQQELTAKALADLIEVQKEQEPRHLTAEQAKELSGRLRNERIRIDDQFQIGNIRPFFIRYAERDTEAAAFAHDLKWALAGSFLVKPEDVTSIDLAPLAAQFGRESSFGVMIDRVLPPTMIWGQPDTTLEAAEAAVLGREFTRMGIETQQTTGRAATPEQPIVIIIGAKPNRRFSAEQEELRTKQRKEALKQIKKKP